MFEKIVAAIDSDRARATKVVEATQELARAFGSTVLVAHVREVERPAAIVGAAKPGALPPALSIDDEAEARAFVETIVGQLQAAGIRADARIGHDATGSTARDVLEMAQAQGADLIVVGDRGSRITDALLGSVANRIAHLAECPVLLVR